jgi:hypothetical protein
LAGAKEWLALYGTMTKLFGPLETRDNTSPVANQEAATAFQAKALKLAQNRGKTQMAPINQPKDVFVFSSFTRHDVDGETQYFVVLYFDERT